MGIWQKCKQVYSYNKIEPNFSQTKVYKQMRHPVQLVWILCESSRATSVSAIIVCDDPLGGVQLAAGGALRGRLRAGDARRPQPAGRRHPRGHPPHRARRPEPRPRRTHVRPPLVRPPGQSEKNSPSLNQFGQTSLHLTLKFQIISPQNSATPVTVYRVAICPRGNLPYI